MVDILKAAVSNQRRPGKQLATAAIRAGQQNLLQDLQEIESRAHHLGLHVTAHALNRAKNACGWELAGDTEMAEKASRDERG